MILKWVNQHEDCFHHLLTKYIKCRNATLFVDQLKESDGIYRD